MCTGSGNLENPGKRLQALESPWNLLNLRRIDFEILEMKGFKVELWVLEKLNWGLEKFWKTSWVVVSEKGYETLNYLSLWALPFLITYFRPEQVQDLSRKHICYARCITMYSSTKLHFWWYHCCSRRCEFMLMWTITKWFWV